MTDSQQKCTLHTTDATTNPDFTTTCSSEGKIHARALCKNHYRKGRYVLRKNPPMNWDSLIDMCCSEENGFNHGRLAHVLHRTVEGRAVILDAFPSEVVVYPIEEQLCVPPLDLVEEVVILEASPHADKVAESIARLQNPNREEAQADFEAVISEHLSNKALEA